MKNNIPEEQPNNPLHGVKLVDILERLRTIYSWEELGAILDLRCFDNNPTIKSSLKFFRKQLWAREALEDLYLRNLKRMKF